ncbi:Oidioi.mRNA.OKI2018_I69.chr1.g2004.t1.cds [Oikopleura dioica]|uniref:Oidioi.mRNA.OKI2018_I69.chr1.g2004.t1.cds n=1 Tax=Oikopleura dioica TaxID=34765 RepID=A0ABN7STZ5_OIKDI|nr:Oidioi.mRNA.OKI2018_I69.chr1.g2004.t1.cds [Oikopleura dioica]
MENDSIPGLDSSSEYEDANSDVVDAGLDSTQYITPRKEEQEPEIKSRTSSLLQLMGSVTGLSSLKGDEEEAETDMSEINSDQSSITADIPDEQQPEILRKNTPGRAPTLPGTVKEYCSIFYKEQ